MYSTVEAKKFNQSVSKFMSGGINKDVTLSKYRFDVSPSGKRFIELTFENINGQTVTKTEWEPLKWEGETDDKFRAKQMNYTARLSQTLDCFFDNKEFSGSSYEDLANWFIASLNEADKTKKLNVKVVYNKDGYPTLPTYSKYTFIEPAEKPETWTGKPLEIMGIDQITRPVIADQVTADQNPFLAAAITTTTGPTFVAPSTSQHGANTPQSHASDLPFGQSFNAPAF